MGDLGDLAELAAWSGCSLNAGFLQINPLHVAVPGRPTDPSPYRPSSRRFPDPVYLRVEEVPEYAYLEPTDRDRATDLLARAAALREGVLRCKDALIDRDAVWKLKREALAPGPERPSQPRPPCCLLRLPRRAGPGSGRPRDVVHARRDPWFGLARLARRTA